MTDTQQPNETDEQKVKEQIRQNQINLLAAAFFGASVVRSAEKNGAWSLMGLAVVLAGATLVFALRILKLRKQLGLPWHGRGKPRSES